MAFENIEDKVMALRNIVGADKLVAENRKKDQTIAELGQIIKDKDASHMKILAKKDDFIVNLQSELREANQRSITYNKTRYTHKSFEALIEKKFIEKVEQRIKSEALRLYLYHRNRLVKEEVNKYPTGCNSETRETIDAEVDRKLETILYDGRKWPQRFLQYFNAEVRSQADSLKDQEFYMEIDSRSSEKLEDLKNGEWHLYLEAFCRDVLTPALRNNLSTQIVSLQKIFSVACPKCGNIIMFRLTPDTLASTIQGKPALIKCMYCSGFLGKQTNFQMNLGSILWHLTNGYEAAQSAPRIYKAKWRKIEEAEKKD